MSIQDSKDRIKNVTWFNILNVYMNKRNKYIMIFFKGRKEGFSALKWTKMKI